MTLSAPAATGVHVTGGMEAQVFRGVGLPFEAVAVPELVARPTGTEIVTVGFWLSKTKVKVATGAETLLA